MSTLHLVCPFRHLSVQVDWIGTGQSMYDGSSFWGSAGTLLGISGGHGEGYDSSIVIHETMHQWGAYLGSPLAHPSGHWNSNTSVGGTLGGCVWEDNGDGTFTSRGFLTQATDIAPPLELYLLGLVGPDQVSPLYWAENEDQDFCQPGTLITGPFHQVTIDDINAVHGLRTPGPGSARTEYRMAVVVTSQHRLLTPLEMTLYNKAAKLIEGTLAPHDPYDNYTTFSQFTGGRATILTGIAPPSYKIYLPFLLRNY